MYCWHGDYYTPRWWYRPIWSVLAIHNIWLGILIKDAGKLGPATWERAFCTGPQLLSFPRFFPQSREPRALLDKEGVLGRCVAASPTHRTFRSLCDPYTDLIPARLTRGWVSRGRWVSRGGVGGPSPPPPLPTPSLPPEKKCGVILRLVCVSFV